jgi:hypothetical protein
MIEQEHSLASLTDELIGHVRELAGRRRWP